MRTQIIKINSLTNNFKDAFKNLYKKLHRTNSQITLIVKSTQQYVSTENKNSNKNKRQSIKCQIGDAQNHQHTQANFIPSRENGITSLIQCKSAYDNDDLFSVNQQFNVIISNKQMFPNVMITSKKSHPKINTKNTLNSQRNIIISNKNQKEDLDLHDEPQKNANNDVPPLYILQKSEHEIEQSKNEQNANDFKPSNLSKLSQKYYNQEDPQQQDSQEFSIGEDVSVAESLFQIEQKLSDAVEYIKSNRIFELQQYLYWFKTKYSCMSDRVQIKWRLLMAYCKENRKEYERASILYQQVIQLSQSSPKALLVDRADVYHKLGICYTQIRKWNDGIIAFVQALNQLKKNNKKVKYAQCLNNLGTLYLTASHIVQAQKCFLISYQIKKEEFPTHSKKLISCLLNIYECNLFLRNYQQADIIINEVQNIVRTFNESTMLQAGVLRRKGRLSFMKGELGEAKIFYLKALQLLQNKYPYSLEYGQLCQNLAIVKLQTQEIDEAKSLLNEALTRLNFYYTKDSNAIQNIKSNLQLAQRLLSKCKSAKTIRYDSSRESVDRIIEDSMSFQIKIKKQ